MKNLTVAKIVDYLDDWTENATTTISKWQADLAVNPAYAMEWSDDIYDAAARMEIAARFMGLVTYGQDHHETEEAIVAEFHKSLQRELLRVSSQINNRSTGQGKNLMAASRTASLAKMFEWANDTF